MTFTRLAASIAAFVLLSAASAAAEPATVASTVNLRAGAATNTEIVAKIPGGSRVEASNCSEWCEVEWQGKHGFAIATALDRSGRPPAPRTAARRAPPRGAAPPPGAYVEDDEDDYVPVGPPVVYAPGPYYYGGPFYGPRWGWGYGYRGRRW
jgi:hypothetical protein